LTTWGPLPRLSTRLPCSGPLSSTSYLATSVQRRPRLSWMRRRRPCAVSSNMRLVARRCRDCAERTRRLGGGRPTFCRCVTHTHTHPPAPAPPVRSAQWPELLANQANPAFGSLTSCLGGPTAGRHLSALAAVHKTFGVCGLSAQSTFRAWCWQASVVTAQVSDEGRVSWH
jgi:hypothetical protein